MSKTSSYLRVCAAGLLFSGLVRASACGGDDDDEDDGAGGTAGSGGTGGTDAGAVEAIECGANTCEPLDLKLLGQGPVAPCCAADDACGLDSSGLAAYGASFGAVCQARNQPGVLDDNCPEVSTEVPDSGGLVISFKGCCRPSGQCGYLLDKIAGAIEIGLGCVESEPFLDGGTSESCDPEGGGGGSGGAPNAGEGGAPSTSEGGAGGG
jgi:hypothetical protein